MPANLIEFLCPCPDLYPHPFPAARSVPDWLKAMPAETPVEGAIAPTIKKCPPFVEAMTCGYVIPLAGEVTFRFEAEGLRFESEGRVIDHQPAVQYRGSPFERAAVIKFMNPWLVRTPPGYSTLFLPPLNAFSVPFQTLSGVVETDTYFREVNFPAVCLLRPGMSATLPKGTPIAQAIPLRREDWQSSIGRVDAELRLSVEQRFAANLHMYKEENWRKKTYE